MATISHEVIKQARRKQGVKKASELLIQELSQSIGSPESRNENKIHLSDYKALLLLNRRRKKVIEILVTALDWYSQSSYIIKHRLYDRKNHRAYYWLVNNNIIKRLPDRGRGIYHVFC